MLLRENEQLINIADTGVDVDAIHDNVAGEIAAIVEKASPVDADLVVIEDSAASNVKKKVQAGNLPGVDDDAIHDNVAGEIAAIVEKATPVNADLIVIEDSAASDVKKKVQVGNLPGGAAVLNDLTDCNVVSPGQGDIIRYNPSTSKYEKLHLMEPTSRIVNFDNSMSAAEIQALIDAVGKYIPAGIYITFVFADGTYTLNDSLEFLGFFGGGEASIEGNIAEADATILHTTQEVFLDFSGTAGKGILISSHIQFYPVRNLKIKIDSASSGQCINVEHNFPAVYPWYNYFLGTGLAAGHGIYCHEAIAKCKANYVSNLYSGFTCECGKLYSDGNDDTGTQPKYGLWARAGATLCKNGTQPAGSTANELAQGGSVIR